MPVTETRLYAHNMDVDRVNLDRLAALLPGDVAPTTCARGVPKDRLADQAPPPFSRTLGSRSVRVMFTKEPEGNS